MCAQLKSLELQGYKTFANKTLFEFSDTITVIVGPNGSGKSNIADSIGWVLGEQSYSILRGKQTVDMIFSGSEQRARAGMASATITFDNSSGWLPIEFNEVAITRRAYRDGHNEYLINGQRTRLKDVTELLSQSGLSERTYTIIGQGLVDAALALKAEERRRLFEEAAGIGLYRSRREEALRRLDATRRNLERVEDILLEIEPRMRSLERQANRAIEYGRVKQDLNVLLRDWYGFHWHKAQYELSDAIENARIQAEKLDHEREKQTTLNDKLLVNQNEILRLRDDLNTYHRHSAELHTKREAVSREIAVLDERLKGLQNEQYSIQTDMVKIEEEFQKEKDRLALLENEILRVEENQAHSRERLIEEMHSFELKQEAFNQLESELLNSRLIIEELVIQQSQLRVKYSERELQIDQDKKSLVNIENSLQDVNIQLQDAIQAASTQNQELAILADKLTDAERNLKEEQTNLLGVRDEIQLLRDQRINYETELTKLLAEIEVIEYAEEKLIGYAEGTRILLQAARDSSVEGIIGSLDKKIKVSEELEVAINAALGEYIDAVIFHDGADISSDILLKQSTRGVLLPIDVMALDTIKLNKLLVDDDEFIGIASEFIECPRELKNIVGLLLGRVIIVRRRETALDIISKIKNNNQDFKNLTDYVDLRIVTLSGEVYCLTGPIIVDSQKASAKGQSLLSRKRHLESLAIKKKNIENKISNIENIITEILLHERELVVQVGSLEEAKFQSENCLETAKQKVNLISSNVDQLTDRLEWFKEQNQILEDKIKDNKADLDQITGDLSNLELRLNEANSQFKIKSTELAQIDYSETQVRVSHWEKELAVAEQSLKDLNTRFSDRSDRIRDMNLTLQSYQHRLSELNNTISLIIDERIGKTNQEVELEGKISDLQNKISPAESKLERLENSQFERQKEETAARKSFSSAEHRNAEARILLASRQDTLEALRRRIEEDIGLVDFEYGEHISGPTPLPIDGFVKELPIVVNLPSETEDSINRLRALLRRIGPINPEAETEYREINKRYTFLTEQVSDLRVAENNVRQVIDELDDIMEQEFNKTYSAVAEEFKEIFTRLFNGGSAHLVLTDSDNITEAGIDIEARLPGRRSQRLSLLSGGERSLTATALVFALLKVSPTPFCLLDEVDAMLDEANLIRFRELLEELSVETQFVVVTHNRNTVQAAKTIYGVTMGSDSVSQVISIKPDEIINDLS